MIVMLLTNASFSQTISTASTLTTADSLFNRKEYNKACQRYFQFLEITRDTSNQIIFNISRSCIKANFLDSTYKFLNILVDNDAIRYFDDILYNNDFKKLYRQKRWKTLTMQIKTVRRNFNESLEVELIDLRKTQSALIFSRDSIIRLKGARSSESKKYSTSIDVLDSVNTIKLKTILNTYG